MIIRKAEESDTESIIELLKVSLGENLLPKSIDFWKWKHQENPFGKSPVVLAEDNGKVIGVRAFLRWEFSQGNKLIPCGRAVDTAVHPAHQGKGIFTKLTKTLLEEVKKEGFDLIYNTPNPQSLPGYLKMGWKKWGRLPLKIQLHFPKPWSNSPLINFDWSEARSLIQEIETASNPSFMAQSRIKPGYIHWRYENCPVVNYSFISDFKSYLLIFRIKEGKWGRELRICDLFCGVNFDKVAKRALNRQFKELVISEKIRFSSFSGLNSKSENLNLGLLPVLPLGPLVTLNQLNKDLNCAKIDWNWSLGDLELF
jgi:GNAT superfamily N-acetyltransferase